ncbi:MAG: oligosaccharide flippase family protein [Chloroflexi bacterium]|nr:oligosaccharide flippase family protein [Chloroflexota bacterium]
MLLGEQGASAKEETPLAYRMVRGGVWVAANSYFTVGFGFIANLALTQMLAPEDFGIFVLAGFFFALINLRPKIGIGFALAQRKETTGELVGSHLALDMTAGLATLLLAGAAIPVLRAFGYSWDVAWVTLALAAVGISDSLMGTAWTLLDKELHFGQTSLVSTLAFPVSYVPAFWLALHGGSYWSLVAQNATYALLLLVGMWWAMTRKLPYVFRLRWRFDREVALSLVRFGGLVGLAGLGGLLVAQFDNFLVGTFVGVATLGFYERAYRIAQWPALLVSTVATRAGFYAYARLQDDPVRLQKTVSMVLWLITVLALPLALAIFASASDLVSFLYGERWQPSVLFLQFLVVFSLLRPLLENAASILVAVGRPQQQTLVVAIQAALLITVATPLTLTYGAVGTAVGVGIAFVIGLGLAYWQVRKAVALSLWDAFALPAIGASLALLASVILTHSVDLDVLPVALRVIVKASFVSAAFFAVMLAVRPSWLIGRTVYLKQLLRSSY